MLDISTRRLAVLTAASALLAILAGSSIVLPPSAYFVLKPLTTLLVMAYAWRRGQAQPVVRRWVIAGLVLSLGGDVALMWPKEGFLPGLVSFLLAHMAYLVAFTRGQRLAARPLAFVFYAVVAGAILSQLWVGVPAGLRIPVAAYVVCLAAMAAQAAVVWLAARGTADEGAAKVLAIGGALFLASDALLAINKFAQPLPQSTLWILSTYWLAQWCIASWLQPRRPTSL